MKYSVLFENHPSLEVEAPFPSLAARLAGERLRLRGDRACAVRDLSDGLLTHWRVTLLESWYSRPVETDQETSSSAGPSSSSAGPSSSSSDPSL